MIELLWRQIKDGADVRQSLSKLRQEVKKDGGKAEFIKLAAGEEGRLTGLLDHEDAKTRKNAALLMGETGKKEFLAPLYEAYQAEMQLFVKSSYLTAMQNFNYFPYLDQLKQRLNVLTETKMTAENQKHLTEEIRQLSMMVLEAEGVQKHRFCGIHESYDIVLLTNRNHQSLTMEELSELEPNADMKSVGAGIMANVNHLEWIRDVRTYSELLFAVKGMQTCRMDAEAAAETIVKSEILEFLMKSHQGKPPFYFRVEVKSKMDLGKRSAFAKKLASNIEKLSKRRLINTTSDYEFEIRLIENKKVGCNMLVKLYTLPDERFTYRTEVSPTSMKPVNAAVTVALAEDYMKEDAQVLDPFCGVGTLLIERHKAVRANTTYGIDYSEDAILKARANTETAHQVIHYINRDFFEFKHEYLFDEIITEMPFQIGRKTEEEIIEIYRRFFPKACEVLKESGIIIMYTRNRDEARRFGPQSGFAIKEEFEISRKEGTSVMILERKK